VRPIQQHLELRIRPAVVHVRKRAGRVHDRELLIVPIGLGERGIRGLTGLVPPGVPQRPFGGRTGGRDALRGPRTGACGFRRHATGPVVPRVDAQIPERAAFEVAVEVRGALRPPPLPPPLPAPPPRPRAPPPPPVR